jgi:hypothetical protein
MSTTWAEFETLSLGGRGRGGSIRFELTRVRRGSALNTAHVV